MTTTHTRPAVGTRVELTAAHILPSGVVPAGAVGVIVVWRGQPSILFNCGDLVPLEGAAYKVVSK